MARGWGEKLNHKVYFVGAGPGDPELITVKGRGLLERADVVLYAGSLVPAEMLRWCRDGVEAVDTSSMTLEEIVRDIESGWRSGRLVVRLHTGDPSLYGAIQEQFRELDKLGIPYEVVPGVTAAFLGAARLGREFTLPERTQTLIFTRIKGRTPVPEREDLSRIAALGASMVIYLSIARIDQVVEALLPHYGKEAPVAVGYRLGLPGERIIEATLGEISKVVKQEGISRHAIIMVGPFLERDATNKSRLYSSDFSHGYRK